MFEASISKGHEIREDRGAPGGTAFKESKKDKPVASTGPEWGGAEQEVGE